MKIFFKQLLIIVLLIPYNNIAMEPAEPNFATKSLWTAIDQNNIDLVQEAIIAGAEINKRNYYIDNFQTALHKAMKTNNIPIIKKLLKHDADPNAINQSGIQSYMYFSIHEENEKLSLAKHMALNSLKIHIYQTLKTESQLPSAFSCIKNGPLSQFDLEKDKDDIRALCKLQQKYLPSFTPDFCYDLPRNMYKILHQNFEGQADWTIQSEITFYSDSGFNFETPIAAKEKVIQCIDLLKIFYYWSNKYSGIPTIRIHGSDDLCICCSSNKSFLVKTLESPISIDFVEQIRRIIKDPTLFDKAIEARYQAKFDRKKAQQLFGQNMQKIPTLLGFEEEEAHFTFKSNNNEHPWHYLIEDQKGVEQKDKKQFGEKTARTIEIKNLRVLCNDFAFIRK